MMHKTSSTAPPLPHHPHLPLSPTHQSFLIIDTIPPQQDYDDCGRKSQAHVDEASLLLFMSTGHLLCCMYVQNWCCGRHHTDTGPGVASPLHAYVTVRGSISGLISNSLCLAFVTEGKIRSGGNNVSLFFAGS